VAFWGRSSDGVTAAPLAHPDARRLGRAIRGVKLGAEVGYQMRLDNVTSAATRICYLTGGVLLRRMLADPDLRGVRAIVFDEFHEHHLFGDISLARALQIQSTSRPDLIILVMSTTLDVAVEYLKKPAREISVWELTVRELQGLLPAHPEGDALVFMPGAYEIMRTVRAARDALGPQYLIFPLHGELPPAD
jgi:ATP-dependent helicase HrpB